MKSLLLIFLGGGIGSVLRYGAGRAAALLLPLGFPWGTLFVNVAGGFAAGLLAGVIFGRSDGPSASVQLFLMTGLLGGFTTFSAFSVDALLIWQRGDQLAAAGYVLASVVLALAAVAAGIALVRLN